MTTVDRFKEALKARLREVDIDIESNFYDYDTGAGCAPEIDWADLNEKIDEFAAEFQKSPPAISIPANGPKEATWTCRRCGAVRPRDGSQWACIKLATPRGYSGGLCEPGSPPAPDHSDSEGET